MKSPNSPVASGDRTIARAILTALDAAGIEADLASELRTRDGAGDKEIQAQLQAAAEKETKPSIQRGKAHGWQVWITYHNYYKAPDLIGPSVAKALSIPYVQIEATRARKRLDGPWADFAQCAEAATDAADAVFYFTQQDYEALRQHQPSHQKLVHLRPFLPRRALPESTAGNGSLLSVGMFRSGDKLASYELIAQTLGRLSASDWRLDIAGDGPARRQVERLMHPFGARVRYLGALSEAEMQQAYQRACILVWPGVNEAFGMTFLEAQARGLTVLAQDRAGVRDVLAPGVDYPAPEHGHEALAARLEMLLSSSKLVTHLGRKARKFIADYHLMNRACDTLSNTLKEIIP